MNKYKRGFTLIELLVVILIIGVLAAVALPQYQKAVLKSRFSTVMPVAKAVANAQEVYYLDKNMYALDKEDLDITSVEAENTQVSLSTAEEGDTYIYVAASRTDIPGARYIIYQQHSKNFPGEVHCEADKNNAKTVWLCEKGLEGRKIGGSLTPGYVTYVLDGGGIGVTYTVSQVLAGLACEEGVPESQCKVTNNADGSKTKKDCTDGNDATTCTWTTFNTDGTKTVCLGNKEGVYRNGSCFLDVSGDRFGKNRDPFALIYDEDGTLLVDAARRGGSPYGIAGTLYEADGSSITKERSCKGGAANYNLSDATCVKGYNYDVNHTYDSAKDSHGNQIYNRRCSSINASTGVCTAYTSGNGSEYVNSYDANDRLSYREYNCTQYNGTTCVEGALVQKSGQQQNYDGDVYQGYTKIQCSSWWTGTTCGSNAWSRTEYGPNGQQQKQDTCINGVDWETLACL